MWATSTDRANRGQRGLSPVPSQTRGPAQQVHAQLRKQEAMGGNPSNRFEHPQSSRYKVRRLRRGYQRCQRQAQSRRLLLETANPELASLVGHGCLRGNSRRGQQGQAAEQAGDKEQRDHRDTKPEPRKREAWKQRGCPLARVAQVTTNPNDAFPGNVHQSAAIEAMAGQRMFDLALRAVIRAVSVHVADLFGIALNGAAQWV